MPTVAIPAEIVGDTETIRRRLRESDLTLTSIGRCCARRIRDHGEIGPYFTDQLLEEGTRNDALLGESVRRAHAWFLANPKGLS